MIGLPNLFDSSDVFKISGHGFRWICSFRTGLTMFIFYLKADLLFFQSHVRRRSDKGLVMYVILQPPDQDEFNCGAFMRPVGTSRERVFRITWMTVWCPGDGGRGLNPASLCLCVADTVSNDGLCLGGSAACRSPPPTAVSPHQSKSQSVECKSYFLGFPPDIQYWMYLLWLNWKFHHLFYSSHFTLPLSFLT